VFFAAVGLAGTDRAVTNDERALPVAVQAVGIDGNFFERFAAQALDGKAAYRVEPPKNYLRSFRSRSPAKRNASPLVRS
jgi:hypothetical protein